MVGILTGKRKTDGKQVCNSKNSVLQVLNLQLLFEHPIRVVKHIGNMCKSGTQGKARETNFAVWFYLV